MPLNLAAFKNRGEILLFCLKNRSDQIKEVVTAINQWQYNGEPFPTGRLGGMCRRFINDSGTIPQFKDYE